MSEVQAFLYGKHALRKIPSGQRDPGDYVGKHRGGFPRFSVEMTRLEIYQRDDKAITEPERYCRSCRCRDTNWGGYSRLHLRSEECPKYVRSQVQLTPLDQYEAEDEMMTRNAAFYRSLS